jgi:glucose/arabinose dehydrogenase
MAFAPDGRLFVCEQDGDLRVILPDGTVKPRPFLHVNVDTSVEHGLVGMAFDPNFVDNGYVYIYYVVPTAPIHSRISRFTASVADPNVAETGSEHVLLELNTLTSVHHVAGAMHFGIDGKLYVAVGEDDKPANAQNKGNLLGKMLRINSDGSIPPDNPFVGEPGARGEIFALGLRNPYRFGVQPKNGVIYVNDVGSGDPNAREEINQLQKGGNYGWPIYEGDSNDPDFVDPLVAYEHGTDPETGTFNCAITAGRFYGPGVRQFPREYIGDYFFADFCGNWIKRRDANTEAVTLFASDTSVFPLDLAVDVKGSLYYLNWDGLIFRIDYVGVPPVPPMPGISVAARRWNLDFGGDAEMVTSAYEHLLFTVLDVVASTPVASDPHVIPSSDSFHRRADTDPVIWDDPLQTAVMPAFRLK